MEIKSKANTQKSKLSTQPKEGAEEWVTKAGSTEQCRHPPRRALGGPRKGPRGRNGVPGKGWAAGPVAAPTSLVPTTQQASTRVGWVREGRAPGRDEEPRAPELPLTFCALPQGC